MSKRWILAGAADQTIDVNVGDSSSTVGAGLTGLAFNSASLVCYYRKGATGLATALTLATQTVGGAHSDGGFVEISSANMPGVYRLDLSDTMVATAGMLTIQLKGAANMMQTTLEIEVVSINIFDAVRMGLTALPNAAAEAAGGLYTRGTGAGQINQDANGRVDTNIAAISGDATAADNLEAYSDGTTPQPVNVTQLSGDGTAADNAEAFFDGTGYAGTGNTIPAVTTVNGLAAGVITAAAIATDAIDGDAIAASAVTEIQSGLATAAALTVVDDFLDTEIADIQSRLPAALVSGRIDSSVGAMAAGVITAAAVATDAIDSDALAADAVTEIQSGLATAAALSVIAAYIDTEVAAIKAKTDNLPASPANEATLTAIAGYLDTEVGAILAAVDTEVGAIKAKTDNLPAAPAAVGDIPTLAQIWTTVLTESYPALAASPTAAQLLFEIGAILMRKSTGGTTTLTTKKLDGTTTAETFTMDDADDPTSIARAS